MGATHFHHSATNNITYTIIVHNSITVLLIRCKFSPVLLTISPCTQTLDFSSKYCSRPAPTILPLGSKCSWMNLPKRLELSLRAVLALPNASRIGFSCKQFVGIIIKIWWKRDTKNDCFPMIHVWIWFHANSGLYLRSLFNFHYKLGGMTITITDTFCILWCDNLSLSIG